MTEVDRVSQILREAANPVVVDLGAFGGEDTAWLIAACTVPPVAIAVEADPDNYKRLATAGLRASPVYAAISDHVGTCTFYKCYTDRGFGSGSIRKPTGHVDRAGTHYDFRPMQVPCVTLDSLFAQFSLDHIDVLWCDIQAAERDMIAGGQRALKNTRYLFMEAEDGEEMYEGQAMRGDLFAMLPGWTEVERYDFNTFLRNDLYEPSTWRKRFSDQFVPNPETAL